MSAKSVRKSEALRLDPQTYGALISYARRRGTRSLSAAARLALRAYLAGEARPMAALSTARPAQRVRPLRLQLEASLRAELARHGLCSAVLLRRFLIGDGPEDP